MKAILGAALALACTPHRQPAVASPLPTAIEWRIRATNTSTHAVADERLVVPGDEVYKAYGEYILGTNRDLRVGDYRCKATPRQLDAGGQLLRVSCFVAGDGDFVMVETEPCARGGRAHFWLSHRSDDVQDVAIECR